MNYRHQFHAGNFADVLKHVVLLALLRGLQRKPKGLLFLDTHAGRGSYDLSAAATGDRLARAPEWPAGVGRLLDRLDAPPVVMDYLAVVRGLAAESAAAGQAGHDYPGSPALAAQVLRPADRAVLVEKHPEEFALLKTTMRGVPRVVLNDGDGYGAVRAFLPSPERRALVLIDPPYEAEGELKSVVNALEKGLERQPGGTFAVWYPLTVRAKAASLLPRVERLALPPTWVAELSIMGEDEPGPRMRGCGMLVVNPPWRIDEEMEPAVRWLGDTLAQGAGARGELRWVVPEA